MGRGAGGGRGGRRGTIMPEGAAARFIGVPPEHLALISEVKVEKGVFGGDKPIMGKYINSTRTIELDEISSPKTARHEVGHAVWDNVLSEEQRASFTYEHNQALNMRGIIPGPRSEAGNNLYISAYATTSPREAFAETYAYATWAGDRASRARMATPAQQDIIRSVLGTYSRI